MRLAAVRESANPHERGTWAIGLVSEDQATVRVLSSSAGTVDDVVRGGREALARVRDAGDKVTPRSLDEVKLGSPVQRLNRDVLCAGWNYLDHFYESEGKREGQDPDCLPKHPTFFTKGPDTIVGPHDDIAFDPTLSAKWDYEAELALVIGTEGRSIDEENALDHVFGWCIANDVSQRDLQRAHGGQWLKGKSIDDTMPLGPWLTTTDEVADPHDLMIECELNGRLLQQASTKEMVFRIPRIIAELSRGMTLRSGDVILTGTPSGIGNAREPQIFLDDGDRLVTRLGGLGVLDNVVRRTSLV